MKFVYFLGAVPSGPIKVGCSGRVTSRTNVLSCGLPFPTVLMAQAPGDVGIEKAIHAQFSKDRLCGEWFVASPGLLDLISHIKDGKPWPRHLSKKLKILKRYRKSEFAEWRGVRKRMLKEMAGELAE